MYHSPSCLPPQLWSWLWGQLGLHKKFRSAEDIDHELFNCCSNEISDQGNLHKNTFVLAYNSMGFKVLQSSGQWAGTATGAGDCRSIISKDSGNSFETKQKCIFSGGKKKNPKDYAAIRTPKKLSFYQTRRSNSLTRRGSGICNLFCEPKWININMETL